MNKKGYTLIELLSVIIIIALISAIAIVSYSYFIKRANNSVYDTYIDSMHEAAIMYFTNNTGNLPRNNETVYFCTNNCPSINYINISELGLDTINNPKDNNDKCPNSYIEVTRSDVSSVISLEYHVYLKCNDYENDKSFSN